MKRFVSIFLLFVFTYNFLGCYIAFHVQRQYVRKEIKMRIKQSVPENELAVIAVNPENSHELQWEHSREFRYKNTMYDVVRKEVLRDGSVNYHCVTDHQETKLFVQLDELVKLAMAEKGKSNHSIKNLFKSIHVYFPPVQVPLSPSFPCEDINDNFLYSYKSPILENSTPPPKSS